MRQPRPFRRGRFDQLPEKPRRPHRFFEAAAREVRVDSVPFGPLRVHLREAGDGPPLLLVHGLMTTGYSWRYVVDELARDFRVIVPDLPGCGRSDKPAGACYSAPALATFLLELQQALGVRGCAVVGNSLGGYLCLRAALADEEAFSRVVNIHSPGPADWRYRMLHALLSMAPLRGALARWVRRDPRRWAHRNVHYFDETLKSLEEAGEYGAALATTEGARAFVHYLWQTFTPSDLEGFMRRLEARRAAGRPFPAPLLMIYARQDPLVPPRVGALLHRLLPEASLVWLDNSSHFAHVDTPEQVLGAVRAFLRE